VHERRLTTPARRDIQPTVLANDVNMVRQLRDPSCVIRKLLKTWKQLFPWSRAQARLVGLILRWRSDVRLWTLVSSSA